jgi:MoaA/NifB/PqqE/SkfB family radical SAM enzyme
MTKKIFKGSPKYFEPTVHNTRLMYLMFTLAFKCNYRCIKCFNLKNDLPSKVFNSFLKVEDYERFIREFSNLDGKAVIIAGEGEPILNAETKELISIISKNDLIPIVYTNGSTLTSKLIDFYIENNVSLIIALDSLESEKYDKLTDTIYKLPLVLSNIEKVRRVFSKHSTSLNDSKVLRVAINTTITSVNKAEIEKIKDFCNEDIFFICNPIANFGNAKSNWDYLVQNQDDYNEIKELAIQFSDSGGPLTLNDEGLCAYSRYGIGINPNGEYMTCAYTDKTSGLLGTINDFSLGLAFDKKFGLEGEFYRKFGNVPCLIRDSQFEEYIEMLKLLNYAKT